MVVAIRDTEMRACHPPRTGATIVAVELARTMPDYPGGQLLRVQIGPDERPGLGLLGSSIVVHRAPPSCWTRQGSCRGRIVTKIDCARRRPLDEAAAGSPDYHHPAC